MDTNRYYQALAEFNEAASQMRLALKTFRNLRIFRDDPSYEIDPEVLRSEVSERMMDEIGDQETKNTTVAVRRQARYREELRHSDIVLQDRVGKAKGRRKSGHSSPVAPISARKKPPTQHLSSRARRKASKI